MQFPHQFNSNQFNYWKLQWKKPLILTREQRRKATLGSRRELGDFDTAREGEETTKNKDKFQYSLDNSYQTEEVEIASYKPRIKLSTDYFQDVKLWGRVYYFNIATPWLYRTSVDPLSVNLYFLLSLLALYKSLFAVI